MGSVCPYGSGLPASRRELRFSGMDSGLKGSRTMESGTYRFTVGAFQCISVSDGAFNYPLEAFFRNVPREHVEDDLRRHNPPPDRITTPSTCLFVGPGQ